MNFKNLVFSHRPLYVHCTSTVRPLYVHCTSTAHTANDGDDGADEVVDGAEVCYDDEQERDNEDDAIDDAGHDFDAHDGIHDDQDAREHPRQPMRN